MLMTLKVNPSFPTINFLLLVIDFFYQTFFIFFVVQCFLKQMAI